MTTYKHRHRDFSYYYGCWKVAGHYLWTPAVKEYADEGPRKVQMRARTELIWYPHVDGGFLPREKSHYVQGEAWLSHMGDWTLLSMDDFTVDTRPGSISVFIEYGRHDYEAMLALATEHFPEVLARLEAGGVKVVPAEPFWRPIETLPLNGESILAGNNDLPYKAGIFLAQAPHAEQFPAPEAGMVWDPRITFGGWKRATHWAPSVPLNDGKKGWPPEMEALIQGPPQGTGVVLEIEAEPTLLDLATAVVMPHIYTEPVSELGAMGVREEVAATILKLKQAKKL